MSHQTYVVGAGSGASLESNLAQPIDSRGNEDHGNSISVNDSGNRSLAYDGNTNQIAGSETAKFNAGENAVITSAGGTPKNYISKGDDVVNYKGMPVQAKVLETMGVLTLNSMGRYDFADEAPAAQPQENKNEPASTDPHETFAMSEEENAVINELIPTDISQASLSAVTSHGIAGAVSGDLSSVIDSFSKSSGQSPEQARESVGKVVESYSKAAERYLENTVNMAKGDIPNFYAWAKQHAPSDLKGAVTKMVHNNQFKDLGKLVGKWAAAVPPSNAWLESEGYKLGKSTHGETTVHIAGFGEMSVKSAARAGMI